MALDMDFRLVAEGCRGLGERYELAEITGQVYFIDCASRSLAGACMAQSLAAQCWQPQ